MKLLALGMALLTPIMDKQNFGGGGLPPQHFVSCNYSQVIGKEKMSRETW